VNGIKDLPKITQKGVGREMDFKYFDKKLILGYLKAKSKSQLLVLEI
jgi:hypothetical protein